MATTTNYSWSTPDDTALVKDGAAAIRSLGTAIDSTVFTNAGAAINKSLVDAAGDLIYGTADNTVARLPIGTATQILAVNSGATAPEWVAAPSSGGMTLIQETVANANTSIDFNSIPGTSKDLILYWEGLHHSTISDEFTLRFNSDSGSNYILFENYYEITSWSIVRNAVTYASQKMFGAAATSTTPANTVRGSIRIYNYASASKVKYYEHTYAFRDNGAGRDNFAIAAGYYNSATAITSLNIVRTNGSGNLTNLANTSIRLVGVS
jgi:hypothetical protein